MIVAGGTPDKWTAMSQIYRCPKCGKLLQLPENPPGQSFRCPLCSQPFSVCRQTSSGPAGETDKAGGVSENLTAGSLHCGAPAECPACQAMLLPGALACMACGFLLQSDSGGIDLDGALNLCPNPACGVANALNEKLCLRCGTPLPPPAGSLLYGRYRLERLLAIGGFGVVYQASDTQRGNHPVALKDMIQAEPDEVAVRLAFFRREVQILRTLAGLPIVPQIYDYGELDSRAYLAMELIRGQDLLKLMESNGNRPFPLDLVVTWGYQICEVLAQMHEQSPPLVHRDLKPDNIMLLEDGRSIKLIDFGTARDVGRSSKTRLAAKTRVYTEGYAPPEQILGKPEPRSDLFALAGTLYHLATGKAPEGFYTARELAVSLPSFPSDQQWFYELLRVNLAEDVHDRYFSAREFQADLSRRCITRERTCPHCQTVNPTRQPFCNHCAEPLTALAPPCSHCGHCNRLGCRFCIRCGSRLR